ncbi:MAG TPA: hypothetical protein VMH00_04985 [Candidatus Limnocylindrales bacterium]|nr:hypothetical protein [Candidatus Limnocylindrales bacterium]
MRCEEAAEFVSALCDGETIPREAAEHVGECNACRARLSEYAEMGMELRRVASLEGTGGEASMRGRWETDQRVLPNWWQKGWETMRIPRFAVALLVVMVVVLGSSLVIVKARARSGGTALILTAQTTDDGTIHCTISLQDEKFESCTIVTANHGYGFRVISATNDRIELGVRIGSAADLRTPGEAGLSSANMDKLVEKPYVLQPGEKLEIPVAGAGDMVVSGELMDHMPTWIASDPGEQMDPKAGELRVLSPVLLRGKEVVVDLGGSGALASGTNRVVEFYAPGDGIYFLSLSPIEGAVQGRIDMSRISFELNGEAYTLVAGAPIARGHDIWVLHKPSERGGHAFMGGVDAKQVLGDSSGKN